MFKAKLANLVGYGEERTTQRDGSWAVDKYQFKLGDHVVTIKQHKSVWHLGKPEARGRLVPSSSVSVTKIGSLEEGTKLVQDLCRLLSFATHSQVVGYEFELGLEKRWPGATGTYNAWRPPFGNGVGIISDFVEQAWPQYQKYKETRAISALIHMIVRSDTAGTVLETQITSSVQCLEALKSYFALSEGHRYGIKEAKDGSFVDAAKEQVSFAELLKLTLGDVGMSLPGDFQRIKRLRNALIHRGFIRETDRVTKFIFGPLLPGAMHTAMFEVMEEIEDALREYILRLLGYKGGYWTYSNSGSSHKVIA
jgi:hypothetical protein